MNTTMETTEHLGISVIICCYNSADLIKEALAALAIQKNTESINWEIVLVDNNSNDNTAEIAANSWKSFATKTPLRVIKEVNPGLIHARKKGIEASEYNILIFCDDDNRLCDDYVATVNKEFSSDSKLAVLGGMGIPAFQTKKPEWFDKYAINYAVGSQKGAKAKVKNLYGAGIALNTFFLSLLKSNGFNAYLTGRKGDILLAGEDTEIIYAMQFMDIHIKYIEQLTFEHFLISKRLTIQYLCEMRYGIGAARPFLKIYEKVIKNQPLSLFYYYRELYNSYIRSLYYQIYPQPSEIKKPKIAYEKGFVRSLKATKNDLQNMHSELMFLKSKLN